MNILNLNIEDIEINGEKLYYMADKEGNCIFNHGNILYGYGAQDIVARYKKLNREDKAPVHRQYLDIRQEIMTARSFEREIEVRDTSERILKDFDVLMKYLEGNEYWEHVQTYFEHMRKDAANDICCVDNVEGNVN